MFQITNVNLMRRSCLHAISILIIQFIDTDNIIAVSLR